MNKKGFTLIEIVAVIILLGVLLLIVVVSVDGIIDNAGKTFNEAQKNTIMEATNQYLISKDFPKSGKITFSEIVTSGFLDNEDIRNQKNKEIMNGCVEYVWKLNSYELTVLNKCN